MLVGLGADGEGGEAGEERERREADAEREQHADRFEERVEPVERRFELVGEARLGEGGAAAAAAAGSVGVSGCGTGGGCGGVGVAVACAEEGGDGGDFVRVCGLVSMVDWCWLAGVVGCWGRVGGGHTGEISIALGQLVVSIRCDPSFANRQGVKGVEGTGTDVLLWPVHNVVVDITDRLVAALLPKTWRGRWGSLVPCCVFRFPNW